jgi:hypothetical protein
VTGYGLGDQGLIPGESEDFSLHRLVHTGSVAYSDPLVTLFPEAGGGPRLRIRGTILHLPLHFYSVVLN